MKPEQIKKGLEKYTAQQIDEFLEYDEFPSSSLRIIVDTDIFEYGYGDYTFEYKSGLEFQNNFQKDLEKFCKENECTLENIYKIEGYIHFYDEEDYLDYEDFYDYDIEFK